MLARFKQQVQETGGFLKKQQQAFAEKVTSSKSHLQQQGQKHETKICRFESIPKEESRTQEHPVVVSSDVTRSIVSANGGISKSTRLPSVNPLWLKRAQRMGFENEQIYEALELIGGQPNTMEDLLQVLTAMNESRVGSAGIGKHSSTIRSSMPVSYPAHKEAASHSYPARALPPLPSVSACGSVEFESASDKLKLLYSAPSLSAWQSVPRLDERSFQALQRMGFSHLEILKATRSLADDASMDDLFDYLMAHQKRGADISLPEMPSGVEAPCSVKENSETNSTSIDNSSRNTSADVDASTIEASPETFNRRLARVVIASVIEKVGKSDPRQCRTASSKKMKDALGQLSPQHGGA